ncbi:MAG: chlorophyll a/b-binding protein [Cyanobacteria bacterium P01_F01_bin.86]
MQESQSVPSAQEETTDKPETDAPAIASDAADPSFGWNSYAERINGRFAMVGFVALLVLELFTRQDFFTWLGF